MKVAVALSGGADSLYALHALKKQGHTLYALHGRFAPVTHGAEAALRELCKGLGLELQVVELEHAFARQVIEPFVNSYAAGKTPNPCASCNAQIKFGLLLDLARESGAEALATGHYACLEPHPRYGRALRSAADTSRDQSYFLALVPRHRLEAALFPLAYTIKSDIYNELAEQGLNVPLPDESREICFVPNDDYRAFLAERLVALPGKGPVQLRDGTIIGQHQGLWRHTEGQRKGLGLAWSEPLYVLEKIQTSNSLVVGVAAELPVEGCSAGSVNLLVDPALWPERILVRTRYRQKATGADVLLEDGLLHIRFHKPQSPPAPGQLACVYDEQGWVLAGAVIQ